MDDVQPGAHIVADCGSFRDSYGIYRVVKVGKVMWEVEKLRRNGEYDRAARLKIGRFFCYNGDSPVEMANILNDAREKLWREEKELKAQYHASISSLLSPSYTKGGGE